MSYSHRNECRNVRLFLALWVYAGALLRCLVKTRRQKATENVVQTGSWEFPRNMGNSGFWHSLRAPDQAKREPDQAKKTYG